MDQKFQLLMTPVTASEVLVPCACRDIYLTNSPRYALLLRWSLRSPFILAWSAWRQGHRLALPRPITELMKFNRRTSAD
jgi:hypothetical protein